MNISEADKIKIIEKYLNPEKADYESTLVRFTTSMYMAMCNTAAFSIGYPCHRGFEQLVHEGTFMAKVKTKIHSLVQERGSEGTAHSILDMTDFVRATLNITTVITSSGNVQNCVNDGKLWRLQLPEWADKVYFLDTKKTMDTYEFSRYVESLQLSGGDPYCEYV